MDYFVLICKGGTERQTVEDLMSIDLVWDAKCFWTKEKRKLKHKKSVVETEVEKPSWPGYLFVKMYDGDQWPRLRAVRTVVGALAVGGYPVRMRQWQFDRLVLECEGTMHEAPVREAIPDGANVKITAGQFSGIEGVFRNKNVELLLFGKKVRYSIDEEFLVKLD